MTGGSLLTVREKVDPRSTALVIIDYQNDFCAARGAFARTGFDPAPLQRIAPALRSLLAQARAAGVPVIFVWNEYTYGVHWYLSEVTLAQARRKWHGRYLGSGTGAISRSRSARGAAGGRSSTAACGRFARTPSS